MFYNTPFRGLEPKLCSITILKRVLTEKLYEELLICVKISFLIKYNAAYLLIMQFPESFNLEKSYFICQQFLKTIKCCHFFGMDLKKSKKNVRPSGLFISVLQFSFQDRSYK